jgi:protein-S-isoprenylcysteine O-methyltransferase Ste14
VLTDSKARRTRIAVGHWLYRHHKWGLLPLLLTGLLLNRHFLSVQRGNFMMIGGAVGILFGTLLRIVCFTFVGAKATLDSPHDAGLITDGPYAVTRNPVFLAEGAIALGIAMMSRMPWLILLTLIGGGTVTALAIEWEEDKLRALYGEQFETWARAVPRWFSFGRLTHRDSYAKTRGRVKLMAAVRAESVTLLIGLLSILAFLAKANLELFYLGF